MTKRQAILEVILSRLAAISRDDGYGSDVGAAIYFGEHIDLGPDDPSEAIGVAIGDDTPTDQSGYSPTTGGEVLMTLPVQVVALARLEDNGAAGWRQSEVILGDIKRAIESGDRSLGGLLTTGLRRAPTRTRPREAGSVTIGAAVGYVLTYMETLGDPDE